MAFLESAVDYRQIEAKVWYLPTLLLIPALTVVAYGVMRAAGVQFPPLHAPALMVPVLFVAFFAGAVAEEVGWSGYATDAMQLRWSVLQTGLLLGVACAAWHIIQLAQLHRPLEWIAWWCVWTVAARVLVVWLYNNTRKSVFAAALFHAPMNVNWQLFPSSGSHWDPRINGLLVAGAATIVTIVWEPRTLARGGLLSSHKCPSRPDRDDASSRAF
jgi:membrane protease YdiL (CAAX protease family)